MNLRTALICVGAIATCGVIARSFGRDIAVGLSKRRLHALDAKVDADPMDEKNVADLIRIAEDKTSVATVRVGAIQILGRIGSKRQRLDEVVTFLAKTTNDESSQLQQASCDALADIGSVASPAVGDVLKAMNGAPGSSVESRCARALGKIGVDPKDVVPALARLIPNRDPLTNRPHFTRGEELGALAAFGRAAIGAVPELEIAALDPDVEYRQEAVLALSKVDPKNMRLPDAAMSLLTEMDFVARHRGLTALEVCCQGAVSDGMAKVLAHLTCDTDVENAESARRLLTGSRFAVKPECP